MRKILDNHIIMSGFYKGISGISLFLTIRLLIDYLGNEGYGIWVLLFTVFQLVLLMDFGVQSTLKTQIPVFVHENKIERISALINSTYRTSILIAFLILICFSSICFFFDLKSTFNISLLSNFEINSLLLINIVFFCLTFIANIHKSLYVAFLKGKYAEQSIAINQMLFLGLISLIVIFSNPSFLNDYNKILMVSIINGGISFLVNLYYTIRFFKLEKIVLSLKTRINSIDTHYKMGIKFMIIQIGFLFIFSSDSYIISNILNPSEIVAYEVINKLFQFPFMILFAALSPLWSMFAMHYLERNKEKLYSDFKKFNKFFIIIILGLFFLYVLTPFIVSVWLKENIAIPEYLVLLTTIVTALKIYVSFYTFFLNGIGKLNFYITILIISLILKIPLTYYFVDLNFGINSVLLSSLVIVLMWTLLIPYKCYKITESLNK
jgi:O-antigen/teichoic acid export membrane protein